MLNNEMKTELTEMIEKVIRLNDNTITDLPYEMAVTLVAQMAVDIFAKYVDLDAWEEEAMTETLSILADEETMIAIAEGEDDMAVDKMVDINDLFSQYGIESDDSIPVSTEQYVDDGSVIWYDNAEAALAADD